MRSQITYSCIAVAAAALLFTFAASTLSKLIAARENMRASLLLTAQIAGDEATAALQFEESLSAEDIVDRLAAVPSIRHAVILDADNEVFAETGGAASPSLAASLFEEGTSAFSRDGLECRVPIMADGSKLGSIYLESSLTTLNREMLSFVGISTLIISVSLGGTVFFLRRILDRLSQPITALSEATQAVAKDNLYCRRVDVDCENELGDLANSFNHMLSMIQKQQEELKQSERMQSIGVLAGGVAHDLNNILGPVVGYPDMILSEMDLDDPHRERLETIRECAVKAGGVLQGLLSLARRGNYSMDTVPLNSLLKGMLGSPGFQTRLSQYSNIQVEIDLQDDVHVLGAHPQLTQVYLNLAINALEAMGETGGKLRIESRRTKEPRDEHRGTRGAQEEFVEVVISDQGCGISPSKITDIFEPFCSTKPMAESGTGLGLAVVDSVVSDHQGFIHVDSAVGRGTAFHIYIPVLEKEEVVLEDSIIPFQTDASILVIDDLDVQRKMTVTMLERFGYRVESVASGREALRKFPEAEFHMIVLDMKMEEDFDGLDTYRALKKLSPTLPCLIMTGDADCERVQQTIELGAYGCIAKPFSSTLLKQQVQLVLGSREVSMAA